MSNLVPRAFSSAIFKMAACLEKTLANAGSRGTKSPKILGFLSRDILRKTKTKWRQSKTPVKEHFMFVHEAVVASQ